ncbi:1,4-alpha-glucan branching protein GlgB [Guggenheimella bovis]
MFDIPESFIDSYIHGETDEAYRYFGAHKITLDGQVGVRFSVYAPHAKRVYVSSSRNNWSRDWDQLVEVKSGVFANFFPHYDVGDLYKYAIVTNLDNTILKSDPYAFSSEKSPSTASVVSNVYDFQWNDQTWMERRGEKDHLKEPMNIYEVNLASWRRWNHTEYYSYDRIAEELVPYVKDLGYTHVELMPVTEYPFDGSWGYQQTGYFSANSRFGEPHGLMHLIDRFHEEGIGVILDWVPSHYAQDSHGLRYFDGCALYESDYYHDAYNRQWDTMNFDFGRKHVCNFFYSNAKFLAEIYHADGLRMDAVSFMIHRQDHTYRAGETREEAVQFIKNINIRMGAIPGFLMFAEDSSAYYGVTKPIYLGGLGFHYKWNMGWMNDTLTYFQAPFESRRDLHDKLTFSMMYAYSEHFVLPLSHDEVVHLKKSLIEKMVGNLESRFRSLRVLMLYQYTLPGKKLLFMGGEFAQYHEWRDHTDLDWFLLDHKRNQNHFQYIKALNHFYKAHPALWMEETSWDGFEWIHVNDRDRGILAYKRLCADEELVVLLNMSPYEHRDIDLGEYGSMKVVFSTLDVPYQTVHPNWGRIQFSIPPLSGVILKEES